MLRTVGRTCNHIAQKQFGCQCMFVRYSLYQTTKPERYERVMNLSDEQLECMYNYIEAQNLANEIGLVKAENDSELLAANTEKAVAYLTEHKLLDTALDSHYDCFFVIVKWGNPYPRRGADEYAWTGAFGSRKSTLAAGKRIIKRGPKTFIDWCGDSAKAYQGSIKFLAACKKVGLNPNMGNVDYHGD